MTNRERIEAYLGFKPASPNVIEGALIDVGLTGTDEYTADSSAVKRAAIKTMRILLTTADTSNENGYAIKYDRASLLKLIDQLEEEIAPAGMPKIRNKSYKW